MNLINNLEILNNLIQKYFIKGTVTNNYVLSGDYLHYIAARELFYISSSSNLCLLVKKNDFYKLYYYINDHDEGMYINAGLPVTMEILYRGLEEKPVEIMKYWEKYGFKEHLSRDCMVVTYKQTALLLPNFSGAELKYAESEAEIIFTKDLIENSLDKFTGDILSYDEVKSFVKKKNVICAYLEGKFCGILQFEIKNNVVWLGHIAIANEFRGKGIANELVKAYIVDNAVQPNTRYQLWVIQDNLAAKTLYLKFGFFYGNKSTVSMLKH
jgi:ribosomal protein S18 acetylase RimI-like enzyme